MGARRPTNSVHGLGRGTGQLCGVCFRGGGVDGGAWGAVAARGAAWLVGLIGADFGQAAARGRTHRGLAAHTRHPLARQGHGTAVRRVFGQQRVRLGCFASRGSASRAPRWGVAAIHAKTGLGAVFRLLSAVKSL